MGIRRSSTQVRLFLKKIGMRCLKVGFVSGKADPEFKTLSVARSPTRVRTPHSIFLNLSPP